MPRSATNAFLKCFFQQKDLIEINNETAVNIIATLTPRDGFKKNVIKNTQMTSPVPITPPANNRLMFDSILLLERITQTIAVKIEVICSKEREKIIIEK